MKTLFFLFFSVLSLSCAGQKVESLHFNLYTDSLKKGFFNYINVDGRLTDGSWQPLDTTHIIFSASAGAFRGNDIFVDSSYLADSILIKAVLKRNPLLCAEVVVYIRKRGFDEPLKNESEILQKEPRPARRKN